ncbi:MAG: PAS domain-containing protein [Archangiaceae bacterium]|nr:PAS domain-containing protein [Archangiaceae bacterium]
MLGLLRRLLTAPKRLAELERDHLRLQREAQRYRLLVDTTTAVVWSTDARGLAPPSTPSWSEYTGQASAAHAGHGWLDVVHPDDRDSARERWLYAVQHQIPYESEFRLVRPDGSFANVISRGLPVWSEDGTQVLEWVGTVQDLTALRRSEQAAADRLRELQETQRMLVAKERLAAVGELSAAVAHEVRNPLGAIFNALNMLRREMKHPLLDVLSEESDRLNRIVADLLDFARPCEPRFTGESIHKVIKAALQSVDLESRRIDVQLQLSAEVDQLPMDGRLVRQLLINLFENAVQAMPVGGQLSIRTERAEEALRLFVADNGPGVPSHLRERVFAPFFTTKATGTGLGLAVVKRIAESHGGSVRLEPGSIGAAFRVEIPLAAGPAH